MWPRPSTTISFQGLSDSGRSSAWVTSDPSGSRRRSTPSWPETTSRRPSGSQSIENGIVVGTRDLDLAAAGGIDRDDLLRTPVREPQPALVPARRLADHEPFQAHLRLVHGCFG